MSGDAEPVDEAEAALDHDMDVAELPLTDFKLPPAQELDADDREALVRKAITRIREGAKELATHDLLDVVDALASKITPADMWMMLLVRMVTRVSDPAAGADEEEEEAAPPPPLPGKRPSLRPVPEPLQQRRSEKEILDDEDGGKHSFHCFVHFCHNLVMAERLSRRSN